MVNVFISKQNILINANIGTFGTDVLFIFENYQHVIIYFFYYDQYCTNGYKAKREKKESKEEQKKKGLLLLLLFKGGFNVLQKDH